VIDFEVGWKNEKKRRITSRRKAFLVPGKSLKNLRIEVIRPMMINAPIISYLSILITHFIEIIQQMKQFKPDVVVGLGILNAYSASLICKIFRIPFVYYLIDSLHTLVPERMFLPIAKTLESRTLSTADRVLVINEELRRYALKMGSRDEPTVITAGIDLERHRQNYDIEKFRREFGIEENEIVLFFMGWLYEFSGLREVAHSLEGTEEHPIRLLVVGRGELQEELLEHASRVRKHAKLSVVDWVPYEQIPKYLSVADVCILPAHNISIMQSIVPIKIYEYLASGKPVIATKLPGVMREFGRRGIVYVDRPEDTVEAARKLYADRDRYDGLKSRAIEVTNSLDWSKITDIFEGFLISEIRQDRG
jgi:glycosyltransferase involved in cell wall biosynthesis